ncbi:MAG: glycosyltransferase [Candidatus Rokubacteria bacterium]|nr:glycosyltransferase [Candidatus Rokubacteria bacterium]
MKILVDGQTLATPDRVRGVGRYLVTALQHMVEAFPGHGYIVATLAGESTPDLPEAIDRGAKFASITVDPPSVDGYLRELNYRHALEGLVADEGVDLYWNPNPLMPNVLFPGALHGCLNVVTMHDMIPLVFPEAYLRPLSAPRLNDYMSRLVRLRSFDHVISVSYATRDDLLKYRVASEEDITVVHEGVERVFFDEPPPGGARGVRDRYGLTGPFVLAIAGADFRKNNPGLVEAFALVRKRYGHDLHLAIIGGYDRPTRGAMEALARARGVEARIRYLDTIPDLDLRSLYRLARVFFFPSLYEGFGLPLLEAMAAGTPVAASNRSSIPEVLGDAGVYFDPGSADDMAARLHQLLTDPVASRAASTAGRARARAFTWERTASEIAGLFEALLARRRPRESSAPVPRPPSATARARVAVVTPRAVSDGVDVTDSLLEALGHEVDIDLVGDLESRHGQDPWDVIVYHLRDDPRYEPVYALLGRHPGIAVLHDVSLHRLIREATLGQGRPEAYLAELEYGYGPVGQALATVIRQEPGVLDLRRFPLIPCGVAAATAVIVPRHSARRHLAVERVYVIPPAVDLEPQVTPTEIAALRGTLGLPASAFVVGHVGWSRLDALLRAFAIFRLFAPDALLLLSHADDRERETAIATVIDRYELRRSIVLVKPTVLADIGVLKAADVVVDLLDPAADTPRVHLRAMAHGSPLVASNVEELEELPDGCWVGVPVGAREQEELVGALIQLRRSPALRATIGTNARRYIAEQCSSPRVAAQYLAVIQAECERRRAGGG